MELKTQKVIDYYGGQTGLFLLKPFMVIFNFLFSRTSSFNGKGKIVVLKMLGAGSLVIAGPSLLGIKRRWRLTPMVLVTTEGLKPFAETMGIFDEILVLKTHSLVALLLSGGGVLRRCLFPSVMINLEVHSRLASVMTALTLARMRVGFYLESLFWRTGFYSHLIFLNRFSGVYLFYEQVAYLLLATPASSIDFSDHLHRQLPLRVKGKIPHRVTVGVGCSDLAKERMLSVDQWVSWAEKKLSEKKIEEIVFLGTQPDQAFVDTLIQRCQILWPKLVLKNYCGLESLTGSLSYMATSKEFWGIDSALLHCARALRVPSCSFWGPTDPHTLLKRDSSYGEKIFYKPIHCSPCIHVTETPPCRGNNYCMKNLFEESKNIEGNQSLFTVLGPRSS